ncbi:MAG: nickel-binding protein [Chloroflexota bacterium]
MARYIGLHTLPGFTREALAAATPMLGTTKGATFMRAYSGFRDGKVVCEFDAASKDAVAQAYKELGFPYDEIVEVEAICDAGEQGVSTRYT